ncbi:MAG: sulfatase [Verrucomicrobiota bacterium]
MRLFSLLLCLGALVCANADEKPNFLIIVADDCTYHDLPIYGGSNAKTPHLDQLASEGLTFNQAYVGMSMCQPCRAELYSGQYPLSNGCAYNHSASRTGTRSLPHFLRPLGYRVGIAGKVHVKPAKAFPFDAVGGFDPNCVRDPTEPHDLGPMVDYIDEDSPFCLVIGLVESHLPWVMGDPSDYPPDKLELPAYLPDVPATRQHYSRYLAEITYLDQQVGEILAALQKTGEAENTLVLFTSEQGSQFPGCKWTNWDAGLHTALIARWPGKVRSGERTDALVQYADIAATLVALAGGEAEPQWDGSDFSAVLTGGKETHREFAFGMHNNLPEGPPYPIRSVTDGRFRYIRNLLPDEIYIEKHLMGGGRLNNPYWAEWMGANPIEQPQAYEVIKRYMRRPAEELYLTLEDRYEQENVASDSGYEDQLTRLRAALDGWMESESDPGAAVDTPEALTASRKGSPLYGAAE